MKKKIIMFILLVAFSPMVFGQSLLKENEIKSALTKIFDLSKKQDFVALSSYLLNDKEIKAYNFNDPSEARSVKRIAKKIKAYLDLSDSYEYESLTFETFKNLPSAELEVSFKSGDQDLTISFIFVQFSGRLLLGQFK